MKRSVLALSVSLLAAAPAPAEEHPWVARFQLGSATIYEWDDADTWGEVRIGHRLSDRLSLRGGASWAVHGDVGGPVVYSGGVELRW